MATNEKNAGRRKTDKKRKYILFGVEIVIIAVMVVVLIKVMNSGAVAGPQQGSLDLSDLGISDYMQNQNPNLGQSDNQNPGEGSEDTTVKRGYMNVALFGVDATTDSQLYGKSRSDCTMIANINLETGDIKLVSVYRDSYLNLGTDDYEKCTHAYSYGGAQQAVKMLNMNLDMDITNFVTISYKGLSKVIDGLGGVYIDVDEEELKHINNYQISVAEVLKTEYTPVTKAGYQLLNGIQATAYCRIRQTKGDDFQRTARQREVLKAIEAQAKQKDLVTLTKVFNDCIGDVYTSIDSDDILELIGNIANYRIVDEAGFPNEDMRTTANIGAKGSCVIPTSLEDNVVWLHQYLFDDMEYTVSEAVKECSKKIATDTAPYINGN